MPYAQINETKYYYEVQGDGPALLLIAGLASDSMSWMPVYKKLSKRFKVIIFDNKSVGRTSTLDRQYSIKKMADETKLLLDFIDIKSAHILGHSMGGFIAQEIAISYPKKVNKLILASTSQKLSQRNIELFETLLNCKKQNLSPETLCKLTFFWLFSKEKFKNQIFMDTITQFAIDYPYQQSIEEYEAQINACSNFDTVDRLTIIKNRTLLLAGEDDIMIHSKETYSLQDSIRHAELVLLKKIGHALHIESPGKFIDVITDFIQTG